MDSPRTGSPSVLPHLPGAVANAIGECVTDQKIPSLNMLDLELLHNYSTATSCSFSCDPVLQNVWRINVPRIGFSYEFVMNSMLAISALHLAYLNPEKRQFYISHAMLRHQTAIQTAVPLLEDVTDENCSALYIFSSLTCIFALASPRKPGDFLILGETGIAEWLNLLRGTRYINEIAHTSRTSGPLEPVFAAGAWMSERRHSSERGEYLDHLRQLFMDNIAVDGGLEMYMTTIDALERSLSIISSSEPNVDTSKEFFVWLFQISDDFLSHLREASQEALVIFAHSCVLLEHVDSHYWWIKGWSTHLVSHVYDILDKAHREWIKWPMKEVGLF
jgi:hypothetical protein